jgi:DNA gyrase subunit B
VERGYIYIAQPPLYKVKRGKQETYVKDDIALDLYLTHIALENAELHVNETAPALSETALANLTNEYLSVRATIRRLEKHYFSEILENMLNMPSLEETSDAAAIRAWFEQLLTAIRAQSDPENSTYHFDFNGLLSGTGGFEVVWYATTHGLSRTCRFNQEFFHSGEYHSIAKLSQQLNGLIEAGAYISRGERRQAVADFKSAVDWLLNEAKRGQHIQRYKGLGEMNPDQLWETTMNPESRRLLQVTVEDAIAADEIFTILMGDAVEPRREFIEKYALDVLHLDV